MGWCQAFGPQIREGCDHSMVAGSSSCSCPDCGVVCKGKFPGCRSVWAAGPQMVDLRRPRKAGAQAPGLAASNGNRSAEVPTPAVATLAARVATSPADDNADMRSLLLGLEAAVDALPRRIAKAAGDAMRQQHNTNKQEMEELWRVISAEVQQIKDVRGRDGAAREAAASESKVLVEEFDARFQWLVSELSKRFMALGNELVRIEKRIGNADHDGTATSGHTTPSAARNASQGRSAK